MDRLIWLVLMIAFLVMEAQTVSVVSLWFAIGSLAAMIAAVCGAEAWLQGVIFLAVSVVLLASLRPLAKKYFTPKITKTNVDSIVGTRGLVTVAIDNIAARGQVKLGGMEWTARSTSGENIPEGTLVQVDKIEGVKAFVTPAAQE